MPKSQFKWTLLVLPRVVKTLTRIMTGACWWIQVWSSCNSCCIINEGWKPVWYLHPGMYVNIWQLTRSFANKKLPTPAAEHYLNDKESSFKRSVLAFVYRPHTLALHMEPSSIECHACSEQYTPRVPLLNSSRTLHLFPPLQVIPKQNVFIRGALRWDIFKTSLAPTQSWSPVRMMPPTQCPSPRPKRPLLIFNSTVVLVCACESMGCTLTGSQYTQRENWSIHLEALETVRWTAGRRGRRQQKTIPSSTVWKHKPSRCWHDTWYVESVSRTQMRQQ